MASAIYLCQCLGTQVFPIATTTDRPLQDWVAALTPAVVGAGLFVVAFGPLVVDFGQFVVSADVVTYWLLICGGLFWLVCFWYLSGLFMVRFGLKHDMECGTGFISSHSTPVGR